MSSCWKCGKDLPEGQTECKYGCDQDHAEVAAMIAAEMNNLVPIDWTRVRTLEDVILILSTMQGGLKVDRRHPVWAVLKRFTREGGQ